MSEVVLDASALLALLRDEPGAAKVADATEATATAQAALLHLLQYGLGAHGPQRLLHAAVTAVRTVAFQPPYAGFGDVLEEEFAAHCSVESASGK